MSSLKRLQNDRYYVLKKLDEGGRGVIYKAKDTVLNRVVAIKMFKKPFLDEEAHSRFLHKAHTVAKLNHPNIVSINELGTARASAQELGVKGWLTGVQKEEERQFFVLEFVDGMSLRNLVATYPEGKCDMQTVLRAGVDVCKALQYAHSQGVPHGDIKPEDILITEDGVAKLMDFGLAEMLGEPNIAQEGMIVTTVAYMAPEIALGKAVEPRSDLYSLGAVLYEMATGQPPFTGEEPAKIMFSHIHDYPVSPSRLNPKVPQTLANCIMKLLEKEPGKRYQTATELLKVLREITEGVLEALYVPSRKPTGVVPSPRPTVAREIRLIDRVEEMSVLREAVDRAVRGEGSIVFLYGEAGIGKTRLTKELRAYARLRGMQVLSGRCPASFRMDGIPPYVLWKEAIRNYLEDCTIEQLHRVIGYYPGEVSKLVPGLEQKLRTIPQSLPISPEHERDRLFEAVSQLFINISKETPLLVILDDLQWTDQSSLSLLHYLARGVYKEALLLLGAYRDTYVDEQHPLSFILTELDRERLLQSVPLTRLTFDESMEMIKRILEQEDVSRRFCTLVYEKTRGNPLFVEEVIKSLKEEGAIYREEDKWKIKEVSRMEFPKTVKGVIKRRIGRLDDESQRVLTMAAFVGKDFTFEALYAITGVEEDRLLELMEKMLKVGLVKERVIRGEGIYSFSDILVRDVIYEEVSFSRRKRLHHVVGIALEKVYAKNIDEHFGELASHFLEGGDKEKALGYFLKAGENAAKIYANSEAASYFHSALTLLTEKESELQERGRVLERLGDIKTLVGEHDASISYWNDALMLWTQLHEKEKVARLRRKMAHVLWFKTGNMEEAKDHHNKALKILETKPESIELVNLYQDIAERVAMGRTGTMTEALSWAEKTLELARRLNDSEVIAKSYVSLGIILNWLVDVKKSREYYERALKMSLDNGYVDIALRAYNDLGVLLPSEEYRKRLEYLEKGLELAKKVGDTFWISWISANLVSQYTGMGNMKKAMSLAEESVALTRKTRTRHLSASLAWLGYVYRILGEWDKSEQYYKESLSISQRLDDFQLIGVSYVHLGGLHFDKGEYAKAREFYEKACELHEKHGAKFSQMATSAALIPALIELREIKKAKNLIDNLHNFALEVKDKGSMAHTNVLRGMLFRAQKKWKESLQYFEKSLNEWDVLGARHWNIYYFANMVLSEYARVYLERDKKGDREKALTLLNQALEIFQKMGAKKDVEKIMAKKKQITT